MDSDVCTCTTAGCRGWAFHLSDAPLPCCAPSRAFPCPHGMMQVQVPLSSQLITRRRSFDSPHLEARIGSLRRTLRPEVALLPTHEMEGLLGEETWSASRLEIDNFEWLPGADGILTTAQRTRTAIGRGPGEHRLCGVLIPRFHPGPSQLSVCTSVLTLPGRVSTPLCLGYP